MVAPRSDPSFTWADLERWAEEGLLQPDQVAAIRARLAEEVALPRHGSAPAVETTPGREHAAGLNLVTVAYQRYAQPWLARHLAPIAVTSGVPTAGRRRDAISPSREW